MRKLTLEKLNPGLVRNYITSLTVICFTDMVTLAPTSIEDYSNREFSDFLRTYYCDFLINVYRQARFFLLL